MLKAIATNFVSVSLAGLLAILLVHAFGVGSDMLTALRYPFGLDYGEGIVWQQAALIPGPRAYEPWHETLPFIVFHYPPIYYLLTRATALFTPNMLVAGRLVTEGATLASAVLVAILVAAATPARTGWRRHLRRGIIVAGGLLVFMLHAVHAWGEVMRVDMVGILFSLAGIVVAARSRRPVGLTMALLLTVASAYAKQTEIAAGVAILLVLLLQDARSALRVAALPLAVAFGGLGLMQWLTGGGFLQNVFLGNVNRIIWSNAGSLFVMESASAPMMVIMVLAAGWLAYGLGRGPWRDERGAAEALRGHCTDQVTRARLLLLAYFVIAAVILAGTAAKAGGDYNYFLDCFFVGTALVGVLLCDLLDDRPRFLILMALIAVFVVRQPLYLWPARQMQAAIDAQMPLLRRIAEARKPVASEDMVLLMQAGKMVVFEPTIIRELTEVGSWSERPVLDMMKAHGFAFIVTEDNDEARHPGRTLVFEQTMRQAYPRTVKNDGLHWVHLPAQDDAD